MAGVTTALSLLATARSGSRVLGHLVAAARGHAAFPQLQVAAQRCFSSLPPHTVLNMPALSPTMSQGNIAKWHVKVGDEVKPGTVLADVETDKATLAFENQDDGFVAKLLVPNGAKDLAVGTPVAVLVEDAASIPAFESYSAGGAATASTPAAPAAAAPVAVSAAPAIPAASYPPHTAMGMPSLSPTMERGNVASWKVKEGDEIKPGMVLAEIETDKATISWEAQEEGFIARILVPGGTKDIKLGTTMAILVEDKEAVPAFATYSDQAAAAAAPAAAAAAAPAASSTAAPTAPATKRPTRRASHLIGPAVRVLLEQAQLTPDDVEPTGSAALTGDHLHILTKGDVLAAIEAGVKRGGATAAAAAAAPPAQQAPAPPAAPPAKPATPAPAPAGSEYEDLPNSQIRKIIAQRLLESKVTIPSLYVSADADLAGVEQLRRSLADKGVKVSVNDIVLKAVAAALREVPQANAFWDTRGQQAGQFPSVDVCFAVATERGLVTPIVKNADQKSLQQISQEVRELATRARANKLKPEEFVGGSFTVSNLGMYGITHFSAIINPPQAGILAVGGSQQRLRLVGGKAVQQSFMTVSLSGDHRVYDGELAAAFLKAVAGNLEAPVKLLL